VGLTGTPSLRVGLGHDLHRLVPGCPLVLGGVHIPAEVGFDTHSDGDVLCHAVIDALAGAVADGDLGTHFPEDDPNADDAYSLDFVREFSRVVADHRYRVANLDSFLILGTIRLRPFLDEMRVNLADALDVEPGRVSVKARSNDGVGPEGEGLAVSARAVVLLEAVRPQRAD
jgi:2-C-methyl-D-erythritol 2,4-cyclodiphosphate synthase